MVVVGGANSAGQAAIYFAGYAQQVTILYRGDDLGKNMSRYLIDTIDSTANIDVRLHGEVASAHGGDSLERISIRDTRSGERSELDLAAMFVFIGARPQTAWLPEPSPVTRAGSCWPAPSCCSRTCGRAGGWTAIPICSRRACPACSWPVTCAAESMKRVASAVGEGSMAVHFVHEYLAAAG